MADAQPKKKRARVPDEAPAPSSAPVVKDHNKYRCVAAARLCAPHSPR